jgi:hypothetical protein
VSFDPHDAPLTARPDGLIEPGLIPGVQMSLSTISSSATTFATAGSTVRSEGATAVSVWGGLPALYSSPESSRLFEVMNPVSEDTTTVGDALTEIGAALTEFSETAQPIKVKLLDIKRRAEIFYAEALGGITVDYWNVNHPRFDEGLIVAGLRFMDQTIGDYPDAHINWDKYQPWIDKNNDLIEEVNAQAALLDQARTDCVNRINGIRTDMCMPLETPLTEHQLNSGDVELPWGRTGKGERSCYESFNDGIEDAWNDGIDGVRSLGSYNPETGEMWDWEHAGDSWAGAANSLGAILLIGPLVPAVATFAPEGSDAKRIAGNIFKTQTDVVLGLIGQPEAWEENPSRAAGAAFLNIGSFFIPGAGQVAGSVKAGLLGVKVASLVERAGAIASAAEKGLIAAGKASKVGRLFSELATTLKGAEFDADGTMTSSSATKLDDALTDLEREIDSSDVTTTRPSPDETGRTSTDPYAPDPERPGYDQPTHPDIGDADNGNGEWKDKTFKKGLPWWARYQEQISGAVGGSNKLSEYSVPRPQGPALDFDGHAWRGDPPKEVFLEAKAGYGYLADPKDTSLKSMVDNSLLTKAERQLDAIRDSGSSGRLEYHFSNKGAADHVRELFKAEGLKVTVFYTPMK